MKLKKYIKKLNELIEKHPEALECKVIYSKDDEGNVFQEVGFSPSVGFYDDSGAEYIQLEEVGGYVGEIDAVCIN